MLVLIRYLFTHFILKLHLFKIVYTGTFLVPFSSLPGSEILQYPKKNITQKRPKDSGEILGKYAGNMNVKNVTSNTAPHRRQIQAWKVKAIH